MNELAGLYLIWVLFLTVLAIVWILLPFAIFGTKPKLNAVVEQLRAVNSQLVKTNELLSQRAAGAIREEARVAIDRRG
jgi:hypothetical protein